MTNATQYLVAVPAPLADAARQAAATWDPAGADSMFRAATLQAADGTPYVFSFGWIADASAPAIQAAIPLFPGAHLVAADSFAAALAQAGLVQVETLIP